MINRPEIQSPEQVRIERLSYGGRGIGRMPDGRVVFVPFVLPDELALVQTAKQTKSYVEAELVELIETAPARQQPQCRHFGICGGCDWQHMPYDQQLAVKHELLHQEVARRLGVEVKMLEPVGSSLAWRYRCHARFQVDRQGNVGFFARSTHKVVAVNECPVLKDKLAAALEVLKITKLGNSGIESVEMMAPSEDLMLQFNKRTPLKRSDNELAATLYDAIKPSGLALRSLRGGQVVRGDKSIKYSSGGSLISTTFGGFIQANMQVNAAMLDYVSELIPHNAELLELFCGSGNLSLPLARRCQSVTAIEINSAQVKQAQLLASENRLDNLKFIAADAYDYVANSASGKTVLIDPPREGAREIAAKLAASEAERLIYVSCNPATLARDLKILVDGGFRLESLRLFDMFPQTYHLESVACLTR